jgi:hypothetical protein
MSRDGNVIPIWEYERYGRPTRAPQHGADVIALADNPAWQRRQLARAVAVASTLTASMMLAPMVAISFSLWPRR